MVHRSDPSTADVLLAHVLVDVTERLWIEGDPRTTGERWAWAMMGADGVRKSDARPVRPKTGRTKRRS